MSSVFVAKPGTARKRVTGAVGAPEPKLGEFNEEIRRRVTELSKISRDDRIAMVRNYLRHHDPERVPILGEILATDDDLDIRLEVVKAMQEIGNGQALISLEIGLGDTQIDIRFEVVRANGAVGGDRALLDLEQVVFGEEDPELRRLTIKSLSREPSEAAHTFLKAATEYPRDIVRDVA